MTEVRDAKGGFDSLGRGFLGCGDACRIGDERMKRQIESDERARKFSDALRRGKIKGKRRQFGVWNGGNDAKNGLLGLGLGAQMLLHHAALDPYLAAWVGWGLAATVCIYISGGISGGHLNPAITLALAFHGRFPWRKVPVYLLAQFAGAFVAALFVYLFYHPEITSIDRDHTSATVGIFITNQANNHSNWNELFGETMASFMFILVVFAVTTDANEARPVGGVGAIAIGLALTVAGAALGTPSGYALNPARDFSPRLFASFLYGGRLFTMNAAHFGVPLIGPVLGGFLAGWAHEHLCVY